jgi:hypothetical protein
LGQNSREFVEAAVLGLAVRQPRAEVVAAQRVGASRVGSPGVRGRRWLWSPTRTRGCSTSPARAWVAAPI